MTTVSDGGGGDKTTSAFKTEAVAVVFDDYRRIESRALGLQGVTSRVDASGGDLTGGRRQDGQNKSGESKGKKNAVIGN